MQTSFDMRDFFGGSVHVQGSVHQFHLYHPVSEVQAIFVPRLLEKW